MISFHVQLKPDTRTHVIGILFVLAAIVIWSTVPVGTKLLMREEGAFSPAFISAARLWVAGIVFMIVRAIYTQKVGLPFRVPIRRKGWLLIAAGAICFNYIFYAVGLRYTTASATCIISQIHSVCTVLLAALLLNERLTKQKVTGMVVAVCGVGLVMFREAPLSQLFSSQYLIGNALQVVAALAWPFYAIGQTKLLEESGNRQALMPIFVTAAVMSVLLLPFTGPIVNHPPEIKDWGVLLFLGAGSTAAAYWLYAAGLQLIATSEGAMFGVLMPPAALLMAHWILGEQLHAGIISGLALVLVGLVLIVWRRGNSPVYRRQPVRGISAQEETPRPSSAHV